MTQAFWFWGAGQNKEITPQFVRAATKRPINVILEFRFRISARPWKDNIAPNQNRDCFGWQGGQIFTAPRAVLKPAKPFGPRFYGLFRSDGYRPPS